MKTTSKTYCVEDDHEFMESFKDMIADDDTVKMKDYLNTLAAENAQLVSKAKFIKNEMNFDYRKFRF